MSGKPYNFDSLEQKIKSAISSGKAKEMEEMSERSQHILITRQTGIVIIAFQTRLNSKQVIEDAKRLFSRAFFSMVNKDTCVFDLRPLSEMDASEIPTLSFIVSLFGDRPIHIVTGKHYGLLAEKASLPERVQLFISLGDLEMFLNEKS